MRSRRKLQHLGHVLAEPLHNADFSDIRILHNCLPDTAGAIELTTQMAGLDLALPFYFNAMTGGAAETEEVNRRLARVCRHFRIPMAVGSQQAALDDPSLEGTYRVVRREHPRGPVLANLGAGCTLEEARRAVDMLEADALQLHLNAPQEALMPEGDRSFAGWLHNIAELAGRLEVPLMVKETGFGMAAEQVRLLAETGIKAVDVSGRGGTDFIAVEARRAGRDPGALAGWGIPTPLALLEALQGGGGRVDIVASGGINTPLDLLKSLALGAKAVALAALPLKLVMERGEDQAIRELEGILDELKTCMALLGAGNLRDLALVPLVILGETAEWLKARGFEPEAYARRDFRRLSCKR